MKLFFQGLQVNSKFDSVIKTVLFVEDKATLDKSYKLWFSVEELLSFLHDLPVRFVSILLKIVHKVNHFLCKRAERVQILFVFWRCVN